MGFLVQCLDLVTENLGNFSALATLKTVHVEFLTADQVNQHQMRKVSAESFEYSIQIRYALTVRLDCFSIRLNGSTVNYSVLLKRFCSYDRNFNRVCDLGTRKAHSAEGMAYFRIALFLPAFDNSGRACRPKLVMGTLLVERKMFVTDRVHVTSGS